jgi:lipoate synthase
MRRQLLNELIEYFEQKENRNERENDLLAELKDKLTFFYITSVSRDDLESYGFDISNVDDATMEELANRMADHYCDQLFWDSMEIIAESMGIERIKEEE